VEFKKRVHEAIIDGAAIYKAVFIDYEYLLFSEEFKKKPYYIISAAEDNYAHLTGVNALITAQEFYNSSIMRELIETNFDFLSEHRSEKEVIGSVRRKIQSLPMLATFFTSILQAEEDFTKGSIHCSLATADNTLTIGFIDSTVLRPKTLLKKNELNPQKAVDVTLILKRSRGAGKFDTVVQGDIAKFIKLYPEIFAKVYAAEDSVDNTAADASEDTLMDIEKDISKDSVEG